MRQRIVQSLLMLLLGNVALADDGISYNLTLTSDYVFRGISQTMGKPALQFGVDLEHNSGLFAYVWASNVDYTEAGDPDDGANWELNLGLGFSLELTPNLYTDLAWQRYENPGTHPGIDYGYNEWSAVFVFQEAHALTIGYNDTLYGYPGPAWFLRIRNRPHPTP